MFWVFPPVPTSGCIVWQVFRVTVWPGRVRADVQSPTCAERHPGLSCGNATDICPVSLLTLCLRFWFSYIFAEMTLQRVDEWLHCSEKLHAQKCWAGIEKCFLSQCSFALASYNLTYKLCSLPNITLQMTLATLAFIPWLSGSISSCFVTGTAAIQVVEGDTCSSFALFLVSLAFLLFCQVLLALWLWRPTL